MDDARSELIGTLLRDGKIVSRPKAKEQRRSRWTRRGWAGGARTLFVPKVKVLGQQRVPCLLPQHKISFLFFEGSSEQARFEHVCELAVNY